MGAHQRHSFTIEIKESRQADGCYTWAIRDRGKLFRRSDTSHPTQEQAREVALTELRDLQRAWPS